jgi:hypothetical protein
VVEGEEERKKGVVAIDELVPRSIAHKVRKSLRKLFSESRLDSQSNTILFSISC